jgi:protein-disulfide isomerase
MLTVHVRTVIVAIAALLAPLLSMVSTAAAQSIDQAVIDKGPALLHDPASPVLGNPRGDVAVIEFFDYACSYCKAVEPRVAALLKSDPGVRLVLKEFPILTPESLIAAKASLASVKQGKYAQFHQALMAYKGPWQTSVIFDTAKAVGLDLARLRKDMAASAVTDELLANFNLARSLRIFQTPGFIVGTHILTEPSAQIDFPRAVAAVRSN